MCVCACCTLSGGLGGAGFVISLLIVSFLGRGFVCVLRFANIVLFESHICCLPLHCGMFWHIHALLEFIHVLSSHTHTYDHAFCFCRTSGRVSLSQMAELANRMHTLEEKKKEDKKSVMLSPFPIPYCSPFSLMPLLFPLPFPHHPPPHTSPHTSLPNCV